MGILERMPLVVGIFSAFSLVATLGFQILLIRQVGLGSDVDIFVASSSAAQILTALVLTTIPAVLVPALVKVPIDFRYPLTIGTLLTLLPMLGAIAFILTLTASNWGAVVFSAFDNAALKVFEDLQAIHAWSLPACGVTAVAGSLLHANGKFMLHAAVMALFPLLAVSLLFVLGSDRELLAAAWIQNGCLLIQALTMLAVASHGARLSDSGGLLKGTGDLWRRAAPLFGGACFTRTELLVDRHLLARGEAGELAAFALVRQILEAGAGLLGRTHVATAIPGLAAAAEEADLNGFRSFYLIRLRVIIFWAVGMLAATWLALAWLSAVPGFAADTDWSGVLKLVPLLGGVLIFAAAGGLSASAFYALGDTHSPTIIGLIGFVLFMLTKLWLYPRYGVTGVAAVSSGYFATNAAALAFLLRYRLRRHSGA